MSRKEHFTLKALQQLLPSKNKSNSLFANLILSFLTIIILSVVFNFISISLSSEQVRTEIIKYNRVNLNHTVESYEKQFELVRQTLLSFMLQDEVLALKKERRYNKFPQIQQEIRKIVTNPMLHIHDIIIYNQPNGQILDKSKSTDAKTMFEVFMYNEVYTPAFWEQQFAALYNEKMLAVTSFTDRSHKYPPTTEPLFPIVFKINKSDPLYTIALLDAQLMFEQFSVSINENLLILDGEHMLFANMDGLTDEEMPPIPEDDREYMIANDRYYFYKTGAETGLTYVQQVPMEDISSQLTMKRTLMYFLIVACVISIIAAWLFVRRINNPLKQVIGSLQNLNLNMNQPIHSHIKEFHTISHQFTQFAKEKQTFHYMNQLKEIKQSGVTGELNFSKRPFVLIVFDLVFKDQSEAAKGAESKWYLYVKEFIDLSITLKYADSHIFQTEKNQILSLVFLDDFEELMEILQKVKATLDFDQAVGYATIALSSEYQHSSELTKAYEEVLDRLYDRMYSDETLIIQATVSKKSYRGFSFEQEQQFDIHLREGNAALAMKTVQRVLDTFRQKNTSAVEVKSFAKSVLDKCHRLFIHNSEAEEQQLFYRETEQVNSCYTFAELESLLQQLIQQVCSRMNEYKEMANTDYIADYISQYVEKNYEREIYLEELADNLKMSSGYLSAYFKNKTGNNFIDYLNSFRITKAQELLDTTDWKVKDIAEKVGYQNISSFNRMFKKYTGITPGEYRKKQAD